MRRAVITGMGVVSSLGLTLEAISRSLKEGVSGVGLDPERKARGFRSALTGIVRGFDPAAHFDRKARKTMGEAAAYGCASALAAIEDAKLDPKGLARPEVGVIFGNDTTCVSARELFEEMQRSG